MTLSSVSTHSLPFGMKVKLAIYKNDSQTFYTIISLSLSLPPTHSIHFLSALAQQMMLSLKIYRMEGKLFPIFSLFHSFIQCVHYHTITDCNSEYRQPCSVCAIPIQCRCVVIVTSSPFLFLFHYLQFCLSISNTPVQLHCQPYPTTHD